MDSAEFKIVKKLPDGTPKMYFICGHRLHDSSLQIILGANQADWAGLPSIEKSRRQDRDQSLTEYITKAELAFRDLRLAEDETRDENPEISNEDDFVGIIREKTVTLMPHRDHFLGRSTEVGQAFDKHLHFSQCCYACQGMMGYVMAKTVNLRQRRKYFAHFDWEMRKDYAHSCAEIAVSYKCSQEHVRAGKPENY
jgi:hypothetical protein